MVEVLLHAAARAATFLIFSSHADCFRGKQHIKKSRKSFQPYTAHTGCVYMGGSDAVWFNLMQSRRLLRQSRWWRHAACHISILCSHTDCDSNNAQRLHFVYNIALCALPFLMLYLWYFANISLVITSILLCLLVRSSQQFYACLRFALFFHLY